MLNVEDLGFFLVLHKLLSFLWGAHSVQGDFFCISAWYIFEIWFMLNCFVRGILDFRGHKTALKSCLGTADNNLYERRL